MLRCGRSKANQESPHSIPLSVISQLVSLISNITIIHLTISELGLVINNIIKFPLNYLTTRPPYQQNHNNTLSAISQPFLLISKIIIIESYCEFDIYVRCKYVMCLKMLVACLLMSSSTVMTQFYCGPSINPLYLLWCSA